MWDTLNRSKIFESIVTIAVAVLFFLVVVWLFGFLEIDLPETIVKVFAIVVGLFAVGKIARIWDWW